MAIVAEIRWDDIGSPHFGNPARVAWRQAVAEIAEKAKAALPECNGRVEKAAAIVLNGDVELLDDGTARVAAEQVAHHLAALWPSRSAYRPLALQHGPYHVEQ